MNNSDFSKALEECGLSPDKINAFIEKMEAYIKEIILYNSAYNLTNTSDHDELITRHILDSMSAYKKIKEIAENAFTGLGTNSAGAEMNSCSGENSFTVADIGSGGGLPGIPLATAFLLECENSERQIKFELVERMEKRCSFLENCAAILGLKNVTVINSEAERLEQEKYDLITFRAFRPLDKKMTKTLLRIVKPNGFLCAYKAKLESIKEEMNQIQMLVPEYEICNLKVPGLEDSERNLVIIQKRTK